VVAAIGEFSLVVGLPYWNVLTNTLAYTPVTQAVTGDQGSGYIDVQLLLDQLQNANARNPFWETVTTEINNFSTTLVAGTNTFGAPKTLNCRIDVTTVGPGVSRWWLPSDLGNYGTVRGIKGSSPQELRFINSQKQIVWFLDGAADRVEIFLQPGCSGAATVGQKSGIPPLQYNYRNLGWNYYAGSFLWIDTLPALPTL
jgi:hypothetical protein